MDLLCRRGFIVTQKTIHFTSLLTYFFIPCCSFPETYLSLLVYCHWSLMLKSVLLKFCSHSCLKIFLLTFTLKYHFLLYLKFHVQNYYFFHHFEKIALLPPLVQLRRLMSKTDPNTKSFQSVTGSALVSTFNEPFHSEVLHLFFHCEKWVIMSSSSIFYFYLLFCLFLGLF